MDIKYVLCQKKVNMELEPKDFGHDFVFIFTMVEQYQYDKTPS